MRALWESVAVLLLGLGVALSGCVNPQPASSASPMDPHSPRPGDPVGAIHGQLVDGELRPIWGDQVALGSGVADAALSDEDGMFSFYDVPAGRHIIVVSALGYESGAAAAQVVAGETTMITIRLPRISLDEPYSVLELKKGFIACGTGAGATGVGGLTQVACGSTDPNQAFLFNYTFGPGLSGILFEMRWSPTQALSRDLVLLVEKDGCDVSCEAEDTFAQFQGCCYLRVPLRMEDLDKPAAHRPATNFSGEAGRIQSRTFPAFGESGLPVTVFTSQEFRIYVEYFYNGLPADWDERSNVPG